MNTQDIYQTHNYKGLWMLVGLVAMLALPLAVGYASKPNIPAITFHADASEHNE